MSQKTQNQKFDNFPDSVLYSRILFDPELIAYDEASSTFSIDKDGALAAANKSNDAGMKVLVNYVISKVERPSSQRPKLLKGTSFKFQEVQEICEVPHAVDSQKAIVGVGNHQDVVKPTPWKMPPPHYYPPFHYPPTSFHYPYAAPNPPYGFGGPSPFNNSYAAPNPHGLMSITAGVGPSFHYPNPHGLIDAESSTAGVGVVDKTESGRGDSTAGVGVSGGGGGMTGKRKQEAVEEPSSALGKWWKKARDCIIPSLLLIDMKEKKKATLVKSGEGQGDV